MKKEPTLVEQLLQGIEELDDSFYKQLEMEYEYENYLIQLELSEYYGLFGSDNL